MLIDWFTVIAQAVNFLILVWLMKHFLYKPVLAAIDEREKKIAAELASAAAKVAAASKEGADFQKKNQELADNRAALIKNATDEANTERDRLIEEAKKTAVCLVDKSRESLRLEVESQMQIVRKRIENEVYSISKRALKDLSGAEIDERILNVFLQRLKNLSADEKKNLSTALDTPKSIPTFRTSMILTSAQKALLTSALHEILPAAESPKFEVSGSMIGGIELVTEGQKIAWSISDYVSSLQTTLSGKDPAQQMSRS